MIFRDYVYFQDWDGVLEEDVFVSQDEQIKVQYDFILCVLRIIFWIKDWKL